MGVDFYFFSKIDESGWKGERAVLPVKELFDGRLEKHGVREDPEGADPVARQRVLTDGPNAVRFYSNRFGIVTVADINAACGHPTKILRVIEGEFGVLICSHPWLDKHGMAPENDFGNAR